MEKMKYDLGKDLVFDFIGDVLEDNDISHAYLMEEAVRNRTNLDDLIKKMEKVLSEEHLRLIEMAKQERVDYNSFDLPGMRRNQSQLILKTMPLRVYSAFTNDALENKKVKISQLMNDHPLFKLSMKLTQEELEKTALGKIKISYPAREKLELEIYEISIGDGTGREIVKELLYVACNENGQNFEMDLYFIQGINNKIRISIEESSDPNRLMTYAVKYTKNKLDYEKKNRSSNIDKKCEFLRRTFEAQYKDTTDKRSKYLATNENNKNSALINQMTARLIDIEEKQNFRMEEVNKERCIQMRPPKCIMRITLEPDESIHKRIMIHEYENLIKHYELSNSRGNFKAQNMFGLVDFYSEEKDGSPRYIIVIDDVGFKLQYYHKEDLKSIYKNLYFYYVDEEMNVKEINKERYL